MKIVLLTIILFSFPGYSHAKQWKDPFSQGRYESAKVSSYFWDDIEEQMCAQRELIDWGIENGQLTRREVRRLRREQKYVVRQIRHYKRHLHLSRADKRQLVLRLQHLSEQIRHLQHNDYYAKFEHHRHPNHNAVVFHNNRLRNSRRGTVGLYFSF